MGEIEVRGPEALQLVDSVTTQRRLASSRLGQAQYSGLLYEHGGFVDDILVHKVADDHYFLCVNASNQDKDFEHIALHEPLATRRSSSPANVTRRSPCRVRARSTRSPEADHDSARRDPLLLVSRWRSGRHRRRGSPAPATPAKTASRSTLRPSTPRRIWNETARCRAGVRHQARAVSAPATRCASKRRWRSTATRSTPPSRRSKPISPGSSSSTKAISSAGRRLPKQKAEGVKRKLVGFEMSGRGIGRDGYEVRDRRRARRLGDQRRACRRRSTRTSDCVICRSTQASQGAAIQIMIRNQPVDAVTVPTPFYKRAK